LLEKKKPITVQGLPSNTDVIKTTTTTS
jgi:hypothetical protein